VRIIKKCCPVCILLLLLFLFSGSLQTIVAQTQTERLYYGIETNGVLCGYSEISISPMVKDGKNIALLEQKTFTMQSALGSEFNTELMEMGKLFTGKVGKLLTRLLGNYLTATLGKVLDIYSTPPRLYTLFLSNFSA